VNFDRTGIILYTINYQACIHFYSIILGLEILFTTPMLTCYNFGGVYLMVEIDDTTKESTSVTPPDRIKTCLKMNVENVKEYADNLKAHNIEVDYQEHEWGTIAKFFDPDHNLCAFRDSQTFEKQVNEI